MDTLLHPLAHMAQYMADSTAILLGYGMAPNPIWPVPPLMASTDMLATVCPTVSCGVTLQCAVPLLYSVWEYYSTY